MSKTNRVFGRIPSPLDPRDFSLKSFIPKRAEEAPKAKKWDFPADALDQEDTAHCVGFSMAHFGMSLPTFTLHTNEDGHHYYYLCKENDMEPKLENGTTVRSAAQVLKNMGVIEAYAFASDMTTIKWWLLNRGPIIAGTVWTEEMMEPLEDGTLDTSGYFLGGHAYLLTEWREDGYIGIQNSWGPEWGDNGKAYIYYEDFMELFMYGGEALAAVELDQKNKNDQGCIQRFWKKILSSLKTLFM